MEFICSYPSGLRKSVTRLSCVGRALARFHNKFLQVADLMDDNAQDGFELLPTIFDYRLIDSMMKDTAVWMHSQSRGFVDLVNHILVGTSGSFPSYFSLAAAGAVTMGLGYYLTKNNNGRITPLVDPLNQTVEQEDELRQATQQNCPQSGENPSNLLSGQHFDSLGIFRQMYSV
ncbi:unnamed protein product [Haemonchus placei]|uniref:Uncharacterized protein n=1 Tax=Haemonchus placei TaxID=6290 RepID=A0A0N4WCP1_HAEPC|nr:unnamed protein product [Haemonchus placei]